MKHVDEEKKEKYIILSKVKVITNVLFSVIPTIWFSFVLNYNGDIFLSLNPETNSKKLTPLGFFISIFVVLAVVICIILYNVLGSNEKRISEKQWNKVNAEKETVLANIEILNNINTTNSKVCATKLKTLTAEIERIEKNGKGLPKIVSNPTLQLDTIIGSIKTCLSSITNIEEAHLHVSAAFKIYNNEWEWLQNYSSSFACPIKNVYSEKDSAFYRLIRKDNFHKDFFFYNHKIDACRNNSYHFFEGKNYDDDGKKKDGSIIAAHIYLGDDICKPKAEFVMFITTRNRFIIPDDNRGKIENAKRILEEYVFKHYSSRIKIELALLVLDSLKRQNKAPTMRKKKNTEQIEHVVVTPFVVDSVVQSQ